MECASPPTYAVILMDPGLRRLDVMRVLRSLRPALGLAAAKALVDSAPQVVLWDVDHYDVDRIRRRLEGAGGCFTFRRNPWGRPGVSQARPAH
jgi:large subunit ribosomal protein L7/L12